ncbi:ATPase [Bacillus phage BCPST]|uniref:ATPase n=1 Tax=Bacillus phage BCPST TaxID=2801506 RepID=A0AAE7PGM0_9CAUD|nr:ATPase [Bacillus phage BCPST]QQO38632.1 ATPase [Bacillus phage BCPST]QSJ04222.1 ATPase [Bacillus phage BCP6]
MNKKGIDCNLEMDLILFNKCDVYEERTFRFILYKCLTNETHLLIWEGKIDEIAEGTGISNIHLRKTVIKSLEDKGLIYRDKINKRKPYSYIPLLEDVYSLEAINELNKAKEEWKEGIRTQNWTNEIRTRDGKCAKCSSTENLEAHHIFNFANFGFLANEIENGITLCETCHKKFHSIFGTKGNNKQQLTEFLLKY